MKKQRCRFSIEINQVNAREEEIVEVMYWDEHDKEDAIIEAYKEWLAEHNRGGWEEL
jgi:hypothetical protein